jgi:hypothetical protein
MTTVEPTPAYPSYSHPLVSWGSLILGALAAIAIGVLLNLLVAVFDATATLHQIKTQGEAGDNSLLLGVFGGLANLIALFTGGFVAARSANHPDHHDGMLHGLGVWAVSFVVAFAILGSGAGKAVETAMGEAAGAPAQMVQEQSPSTAPLPPATAAQQRAAEADAKAEAQAEAHDIAKGAVETAFWGFAAMLIGLVAALFGGVVGARHPTHYAVRPRRTYIVT